MLASSLKDFVKSNTVNSSLIIIFNKVKNLFTQRLTISKTDNLDIGYHIIFNYMLSYLKKLSI